MAKTYHFGKEMETGPMNSPASTIFKVEPKIYCTQLRMRPYKKAEESHDDQCVVECQPLLYIYIYIFTLLEMSK